DLAGEWRRADAAERDTAQLPVRAEGSSAGTVRRGDHAGRPRAAQVSDRHAGSRGDLHQSPQRLRRAAQDRATRLHMVQLAVSVFRLMRAALFIAVALLAGCALKAPPTHTDVIEQALPKSTRIPPAWRAEPGGGEVTNDWLKSFDDPTLDAIVAEAIANNLDLRAAAERVTIAQQSVIVVGAQLLPQVGAQLGAKTVRDKDQNSDFNSTVAYVGVAWELDVWGRLRAQRAASEAAYQATALDYA